MTEMIAPYRFDVRELRGIVCFLNEVERLGLVGRCSGIRISHTGL